MTTKQKFRSGQRVVLPDNPDEGMPREEGVISHVEDNGMLIVTVDQCFRDDGDDGLREVHEDDVRAVSR